MSEKISQPGFGSYLLAMILPFVYFFMKGRWVSGIICLGVCVVSIPLMFMIIGFIFYGIMASWAIWGVRIESIEAHANRTAQKTAEAIVTAQRRAQEAS